MAARLAGVARRRLLPSPRRDAWAKRRPHHKPLTRDDVVRAALQTLDEVGLDGLTMRRLATQLGVQSPSLYWHVRDKDELLSLIADTICAEIVPPSEALPWAAQLDAMGWEYRRVLLAHRDAALILANTPPSGPNRLRLAERMLATVVRAGFPPRIAGRAALLLLDFATNAVIEEGRSQAMSAAIGSEPGEEAGGWSTDLPADEYPTLLALAADLAAVDDPAARYRFGITVLLGGLQKVLATGDDETGS
jgi:TetR/AcrR family tetracycline transcriptional repressor